MEQSHPEQKTVEAVKELAAIRGWPEIKPNRFWPSFLAGLFLGVFGGGAILLLLTRGNTEGVSELLSGGGGGAGLIIMVVAIIIGVSIGIGNWRKSISGETDWSNWIARNAQSEKSLLYAKSKLEAFPAKESNPG